MHHYTREEINKHWKLQGSNIGQSLREAFLPDLEGKARKGGRKGMGYWEKHKKGFEKGDRQLTSSLLSIQLCNFGAAADKRHG